MNEGRRTRGLRCGGSIWLFRVSWMRGDVSQNKAGDGGHVERCLRGVGAEEETDAFLRPSRVEKSV
jgi:hypothetical protein